LTASIVLLGLIMVASASIGTAAQGADPFAYLERQLAQVLIGVGFAAVAFCIPTETLDKISLPLLLLAALLLGGVLIPGLGHMANGSRRWLRFAGLNFQVSEAARVLTLIYLASYAVRREEAICTSLGGVARPIVLLALMGTLLLAEPDFGAASVLMLTGFGILFIAGARLRWVLLLLLLAAGAMTLLVLFSSYRM